MKTNLSPPWNITFNFRNCESPCSVRLPAPSLLFAVTSSDHLNLISQHECRIETDTELADERQVWLRIATVRLDTAQELLGTAVGDRSQVLHEFVVRQSDPGVSDDKNLGLLVGFQGDLKRDIIAVLRFRQLDVPELVE